MTVSQQITYVYQIAHEHLINSVGRAYDILVWLHLSISYMFERLVRYILRRSSFNDFGFSGILTRKNEIFSGLFSCDIKCI